MASPRRSEAMEFAEKLLTLSKHEGVRVTELRDTWTQERIIFEHITGTQLQPLKIVQESEAEFCKSLADYYRLPARLTMGRIMRAYLDQHSLTMAELLFNAGHLLALDRMDRFFPSVLQHGAQLQAKLTGQTKTERQDKLFVVFNKVLDRARNSDNVLVLSEVLAEDGIDQLLEVVARDYDVQQTERVVCGTMANHLEGCGWREKLARAISIAEGAQSEEGRAQSDAFIAEILDGKQVIEEVFGGFTDPIHAWTTYVTISCGRFDKVPTYMSPDLGRLSALFAHRDLPETRTVLMQRIARGLSSTQALSKNTREENRVSFLGLVRDLIEPTGIVGGPVMVEAVVLRAKTLLGEHGEDLPIDTAIRQAMYLMPSQAARLGVLLDLSATETGQRYEQTVLQQLAHLLDNLGSLVDLFPIDVLDHERDAGLSALRERLGMSQLHEDLRATVESSLHRMTKPNGMESKTEEPAKEDTVQAKDGELVLQAGDVLFAEGEEGDAAYYVMEGRCEVMRTIDGHPQSLAVVGKGEIVGEMALIDKQPRMATVRALEDSKFLSISAGSLQGRMDKLAKDDQVLHYLIKTLVRRLRGLARSTE
ncbi:cyclic nucleotide-binding domain-containing protein [Magnetovibrio sp. PR-2]|uniref:cyclic nucleotide-binding domain-containing protein n=1 Tax=Magnetovibrio sp. PR-2 TaxID=3120356 RepID=UPI002FCE1B2E